MKINTLVRLGTAALILMMASCGSALKSLQLGAINSKNEQVEDISDTGKYIRMLDGTKLYGNSISYKIGFMARNEVEIDGAKFKVSAIRGYKEGNKYYAFFQKAVIQRIIRGKINVYFTRYMAGAGGNSYLTERFYYQFGEDGAIQYMDNVAAIKKSLEGCEKAIDMVDYSNKELRNLIKENPRYLNEVFEFNNNGCKVTKKK